jgi:hypothetical protein
VSPQEWADEQGTRVAEAVRSVRRRKKRSAQWVADRTAEIGYPISRATIADLENGRRKWVTIAELLVLARALNTAPIALLYPDPLSGDSIEILPKGVTGSKTFALQWFSGEVDTPNQWICDDDEAYRANLEPVQTARRISELEEQKLTLMKVFQGRSEDKWDEAAKAVPEITRIQREIDKLKGTTDGG